MKFYDDDELADGFGADLDTEKPMSYKDEIDSEASPMLAQLNDDADDEVDRADMLEQASAAPTPMPMPKAAPSVEDQQKAALAKISPSAPEPAEPAPAVQAEPDDLEKEFDAGPSRADRLAQMMAEYRSLQEQAQSQNSLAGVMEGANRIGTAMAGRYSGKFDVDPNFMKGVRDNASQSVKNFEAQQAMRKTSQGLIDEDELRDPTSKISDFYGQMALKRGFTPEDIKGKSAWDIQQMSKVLGPNKTPKTPTLKSFHDNVSKKDLLGTPIEMPDGTMAMRDSSGNVYKNISPVLTPMLGIAQGTGGNFMFNRNENSMSPLNVPAPNIAPPTAEKKKPSTNELFRQINQSAPKDAAELRKAQDEFSKENSDSIHAYSNVDKVIQQIDEATTNPAKASQIGAMVSDLFEKGRKTDEDVKRYTARNGWMMKAEDWFKLNKDGTFDQSRANDIKNALTTFKSAVQAGLQNKINAKAANTHLATGGIDEQQMRDLVYKLGGTVTVRSKKGTQIDVPEDKAAKLIQTGRWEQVK